MERIKVAAIFAASRNSKVTEPMDFFMADQFLNAGLMMEHDRGVRKQAIEDMACWIPDSVEALSSGKSATNWLAEQAEKL
jgi:hypothetical protein